MSFIILYVTFSDELEAEKIISSLLKKELIKCANTFPVKSQYSWNKKIENSMEVASLLKLKSSNWRKVEQLILKLHSYETPCIMKLDVEANREYERWIKS
ncbi:MAG: divalent-cation tolerance protein CutA [Candidatus Nanoarchaeia archaeon]